MWYVDAIPCGLDSAQCVWSGREGPEVVAVVAVVATHSVNIPSAADLCT